MDIRTILLTVVGFLLLGLGVVGVFVPVLPTTPFVLAGVSCLSGTPRLRKKVLSIKFFHEYYENYEKGSGLPKKTVIKSLVFLWGMLSISMLVMAKFWVYCLLTFIGVCVTTHILHISKPREGKKK